MGRAIMLLNTSFPSGLPSVYSPANLAPNLVGWWAADQQLTANGSNQVTGWNDLSGLGNTLGNGTPANSLVETAVALNGKPGVGAPNTLATSAFYLTSAAAIPQLNFQTSTPFSIGMIIKRQKCTNIGGTQFESLITNNNSTANAIVGWQIMVGSGSLTIGGGALSLFFNCGSRCEVHGSTVLIDGVPYFILLTYDGSGSAAGFQFYVNGVAETMTVVAAMVAGAVTNGPLLVGGMPTGDTHFYDADTICEAFIANIKMSPAQITFMGEGMLSKWAV